MLHHTVQDACHVRRAPLRWLAAQTRGLLLVFAAYIQTTSQMTEQLLLVFAANILTTSQMTEQFLLVFAAHIETTVST